MSGTSVDAALVALVALWRSVAPAGVAVIDGPAYDPPADFLAVGWDRSDQPAVVSVISPSTLSGIQSHETFDVSCLLSFSYDAAEVTTVRGLACASFDVFAGALSANQGLDDSVANAQITGYEMTPILTDAGSVLDFRFTARVQAVK